MNRPTTLTLSTMTLLCLGAVTFSPTLAQTDKELVGTWTLVSTETVRPDGSRAPTFGDNPKGIIVFTSDGRFIYLYSRGDLPKFASDNRTTGTADENKAVVQGSIATFGTYSVAGKELSLKIEHSTFPNWIGADQKRTIAITGDELKWHNPAGSGGGVVELVLKRAPARSTN
jgi:lipocalin-like protein